MNRAPAAFARPVLCLVTDRRLAGGARALPEVVAEAAAGGADWVQLREKDLGGRALYALAQEVRAAADARGLRGLRQHVNRRLDVALAARCAGVHFGFDGLGARAETLRFARAWLPTGALIGVSAHSAAEVQALAQRPAAERVDYVQLAPVFAPLSKEAARPALGTGELARAVAAGLPVLAQGGLNAARARECVAAGCAGVCLTGGALLRADVRAAVREVREALDAAHAQQNPAR